MSAFFRHKIYMSHIFNPHTYTLISDPYGVVNLPENVETSYSILVVNISNTNVVINSTDENVLIYNQLYARTGESSIEIVPNRMIYLCFFQNFEKTSKKWLSHLG